MGEITTRPHAILDNLVKDVQALYPARVNTTCGLHIHASFSAMDMSTLADKRFWDFYRERWKAWGQANEKAMGALAKYYWARYDGRWKAENPDRGSGERKNFCKAEFKPVVQLGPNQEDRYTQLNFVAWHKYKTLEARQLPMFPTSELAVAAIREMSDIYDTYLAEYQYPKISIYKEWKAIGDVFVDETVIPTPDLTPLEESKSSPCHFVIPEGTDGFSIEGAADLMWPHATEVRGSGA